MARIARKPNTKQQPARRAAGRTVNVEKEEPYEEDEGYGDKLADAEEPEPPEDPEQLVAVDLSEESEIDERELPEDEEDEGAGNRGARMALDRGFAAIDEARRREQRGERGD